jgi:hypothetical protein
MRGDCQSLFKKGSNRFLLSNRAIAIPVTYLILFVTLIAIISATYSFAIVKISARGATLRASVAKQNMQILDSAIRSVAWSYGASEVVYIDDSGGIFHTDPTAKRLTINFTDEQSFSDIVFDSSVGRAFCELESSEYGNEGLFIRGDQRAIVNQSAVAMTQLYFATGNDANKLTLCYRPSATAAPIGMSNGKPLNLIRVYVMNLNSSENSMLREQFYLRVTATNVTTVTRQRDFNVSVSSLALKAIFDGTSTVVWLPVSSNVDGAIVNLEIVLCNVKIQRAEV